MSSILPVIIIIFAIAMIVGPIMMLQPSRGQLRTIKLRQEAAKNGLIVHSVEKQTGSGRRLMCYLLTWPDKYKVKQEWALELKAFEHGVHFNDRWDWLGSVPEFVNSEGRSRDTQGLKNYLISLPEGVYGVGSNRMGCYCEWNEHVGDGTEADAITSLTTRLGELAKLTLQLD